MNKNPVELIDKILIKKYITEIETQLKNLRDELGMKRNTVAVTKHYSQRINYACLDLVNKLDSL